MRRAPHRNRFSPLGCSVMESPRGLNQWVCARWCPTLPHPGGCSTIGAVRLSFRVRNGSGRFPVAVTTETTTWAVLDRHLWCGYSVIGPPADPHPRMLARGACVGGWVGCGPYSGRSRYCGCPPLSPHAVCVCCVWGVVVCIGLLVPVSSINRYQSSTPGLSTQSSTGSLPEHQKCPAETSS